MTLRVYNTLSRKKEPFKPLKKREVTIYTCGPTVYDYVHIGNFREYTFEDILRRYLKHKGYRIHWVMNITDVDDKTIKGAKKTGMALESYTKKYTNAFWNDLVSLNIQKPKNYVKATDHITDIVLLIQKLLSKGYAYRADKSIYFNIKKFKKYGKLSQLSKRKIKSGARVNQDEYQKNSASDFVLWKAWKKKDGSIFWDTAIGKGRPGWHIECSAMAQKYLGETLDIHTGGVDLIFPHHENEIAQSQAATGKKFVRYWLHGEHLLVNGKKMAKSANNFYTLRDLVGKGYDPLALRILYLSTHYRDKLNFTEKSITSAGKTLKNIEDFLFRLSHTPFPKTSQAKRLKVILKKAKSDFEKALDNDLGTPQALQVFFNLIKQINKLIDKEKISIKDAQLIFQTLTEFDKILGILPKIKEVGISAEAKKLIEEREKERKKRNFKKADKIRKELEKYGILVEDTGFGPRWKKVK